MDQERETELRRRFLLEQPTAEARERAALAPEVREKAEAYFALARRFKLGVSWARCVEVAAKGEASK